jgi:hypothetical protein
MAQAPIKQRKTLELYASLMEEVKLRESSAWNVIHGELNLPPPLGREYCFLQVRMIIETMALGCLVVHGDIPDTQTNKFLGAYSADQIMKMLEGLHPGFYPEPVQMTTGTMADGKKHHHLEILTNEYLLKKTLVRYYARCGDVLHRGTVKKLQKASSVDTSGLDEPKSMLADIRKLLERHVISLFSPDTKFVGLLSDPMAGGRTTAAIGYSAPLG